MKEENKTFKQIFIYNFNKKINNNHYNIFILNNVSAICFTILNFILY